MKLICSKNLLLEIINTVQKAVSSKSVMPILECIKLDADLNGEMVITGNNLDIAILPIIKIYSCNVPIDDTIEETLFSS